MKVLVTGGCGFIGSNFIRSLLKNDHCEIVNMDLLAYSGNLENQSDLLGYPTYQFVRGDVNDFSLMKKWCQWADAIVHFAAQTHVDRSILEPSSFMTTNILGACNLLEAVRGIGAGKKRVVYISTDEVYGIITQGKADEESALRPNSPYSASKASGDLLVRAYNHTYGLGVITTRTSNNFGPYQYPEKLIPLAVTNLMEGKKIPVYGDGLQERDWIYVEDNCSAIALILREGKEGEVYNIATGQTMTNLSVVGKILEQFGKPSSWIEYVKDRPGHDTRYSLSSEKLRKLGWAPHLSFEEGLGKTVSWYQTHRGWWEKIKGRKEDFVQYYELQYSARR